MLEDFVRGRSLNKMTRSKKMKDMFISKAVVSDKWSRPVRQLLRLLWDDRRMLEKRLLITATT